MKKRMSGLIGLTVMLLVLAFQAVSYADTYVHGGSKPGWGLDGNRGVITDVYKR